VSDRWSLKFNYMEVVWTFYSSLSHPLAFNILSCTIWT
jgi:hypothetical protein